LTNFGKTEWDICVRSAVFAYNISFSRPLQMSPFEYKTGRIPIFEEDKKLGVGSGCLKLSKNEIIGVSEEIKIYKSSYGGDKVANKFNINDKVLYYNPFAKVNKLESHWISDCVIKEVNFKSYLVMNKEGKLFRTNEMYLKRAV
jgi:hypothetical protein